ncbi:MAG: hypothetical protein QF415_11755 [Candidatus Undinarchaeales archaeon]|nr:hypothetical protein [Candidatus Undinarchaeales archaeon]MDP7493032.1 hypothetical protein [Candidatus Undinarchaeales archaeon]
MRRAVKLINPNSIFFWMNKSTYSTLRNDFDSFAERLDQTVTLLRPLFSHYFEGKSIDNEMDRILAIEKEVDRLFNRIHDDIRSLDDVAANEKEDLLRLLFKMEEVVDYVEFVARLLKVGKNVHFPPEVQEKIISMVEVLTQTTDTLYLELKEHEQLSTMEELSKKVSGFEELIDELYIEFIEALMLHDELSVPDYTFIKDIGTVLEDMSDALDEVEVNQRVSIFSRD